MAERHGNAITFQGWRGGEFGLLDPGVAGRREEQMFTGSNVMLYESGLLGPRPGLKEVTTTSSPTSAIWAMDSWLGGVWLWNNGSTYQIDPTAGTPTWSAAYTETNDPGTPTHPIASRSGSFGTGNAINIEATSTTAGLYIFNHSTATITRAATSPAGQAVGGYLTRLVANTSNTLYFSDPAPAYTTWGASSFVTFGALGHTYYNAFRDGLLVATVGGEFWLVTGVLGATTYVRRLSGGGAPFTPTAGLAVPGEKLWYFYNVDDSPASFNGAVRQKYEYLAGWSGSTTGNLVNDVRTPAVQMTLLEWAGQDDWVAFTRYSDNALMYTNGIFTKHAFGVNLDPFVAGFGQQLFLAYGGASPKYYWWQPAFNDRPGFTGDTYAQPGDASTTPLSATFTTPEWWDDDGHMVRVQQVIVDYTTWQTGSSTNNFFDVTVTSLNKWAGEASSNSTTVTALDAAGSGFSTSGTIGRAIVSVGDQGFGGGFQIKIGNLKGTAIKSITAVLSNDVRRP